MNIDLNSFLSVSIWGPAFIVKRPVLVDTRLYRGTGSSVPLSISRIVLRAWLSFALRYSLHLSLDTALGVRCENSLFVSTKNPEYSLDSTTLKEC